MAQSVIALKRQKTIFEETTLQYMELIYKAALRMTKGNETEAQDLVQDTYLRAYRFFDKFRQGTNAKTWLLKILRNVYINKYRKAVKTPEMVSISDAESAGELTTKTTPEDEVFGKLLDDDVAGAIGALPENFRACVVMADIDGFSYEEIAGILDIPKGTVMSRIFRGRQLLKKALHEYARKQGFLKINRE